VTNQTLERELGLSFHDWLVENVGIEARHYMADDECTSDLAVAAAKTALERAGIGPRDVDLLIVATDTPDHLSPATAAVVQAKLGIGRAPAFDVNCACASFVTALDMAERAVRTEPEYRHALVVGAYGMSRFLDFRDKRTCTLFADGAGAVVLGAADRPGILASRLEANGDFHDALGIYTGGTARPASVEAVTTLGPPHVAFVRKFPATFNTERWPALVRGVLDKAQARVEDVSLFLFTQLNRKTIEATMDALHQPLGKTHFIMQKWGYTGSACLPMALDDALQAGRVAAGDLVVLCATGGGLALGCTAIRWS
jgi:3-oxoacyl-[acyl-carrier-protein] synthase-3